MKGISFVVVASVVAVALASANVHAPKSFGANDTNVETVSTRTKRRTKRSTFESFLLAHTLNPTDPRNSYYDYWTVNDWDYWARSREPLYDIASDYRGTPLSRKQCNAVIIATPSQVERAFEGPLYAYDRYSSIYWSNRRFKLYLLQRDRRNNLDVYECGYMFFASRLLRGNPVNLWAAFPQEYDYQTYGDLTGELERHCRRLPYSTGFYNSRGGSSHDYDRYDHHDRYDHGSNSYGSGYNNYGYGTYGQGYGHGYGQSYYYSPDSSYRYYVGNGYTGNYGSGYGGSYASGYGWGSGSSYGGHDRLYTYKK